MSYENYKPYQYGIEIKNRKWPNNIIKAAPKWCSVDLRDGNQALINPMSIEQKIKMFNMLVDIGFKEIEVGFPAASDTEYQFMRKLIEENHIPKDVTIQVLTQTRNHLIDKTFEAIKGVGKAVVHIYNSTSELQRRVVFNKSKKEIIDIALNGTKRVKELSQKTDSDIILEYSPESFTGTEMSFALEICQAVIAEWNPSKNKKMIINLPATVEMTTPNVFADQVEWFSKNIKQRENVIISVHTHNDRGTGVAASELAMLAGADRIEGTLFGNGERTGNADLLILAMNLYSQGINPEIKIERVNDIIKIYNECTGMNVHERHPYAGQLVFTAFSGSHQDAIRKGLKAFKNGKSEYWEVPYLPINPAHVGREYEPIIRINSQSGKGGVAYVIENEFGYNLPKSMHPEFGSIIQRKTDQAGRELTSTEIFEEFKKTYFNDDVYMKISSYNTQSKDDVVNVSADLTVGKNNIKINGNGNGPISAFFDGLKNQGLTKLSFETYEEHSLGKGESAEAVAYIGLKNGGKELYGVGVDKNTTMASFKAIICALNRYYELTKLNKQSTFEMQF